MKKIVKQVAGIDVSQEELAVCMGRMYEDLMLELYAFKSFANTPKGYESLVEWVDKQSDPVVSVRYVMEATGVYHESLAYWLDEQSREVSIVLPNKISNYQRTLDVKTVTDKTSSEAICRFGLERTQSCWSKPKKIFGDLKQLTRERSQVIEEKTMLLNQLHAEQSGAYPRKTSITRINNRISLLERQEKEIMEELKELLREETDIQQLIELLCSLPGIGLLTAATVLAETNGFDLIRNKRQLASYAGLDVKEKQSGSSVKGKARISKKGNKYLRKAMHFPALTAIRHDERFKAVFARIISKHGIKMKAVVAVQRKLLEMAYTLYKTNQKYDKEYLQNQQAAVSV